MKAGASAYFDEYTFTDERRKLNVPELLKRRAVRITYAGDGKGGYDKSTDEKLFSVVTLMNDESVNSPTPTWPDKPQSYALATKLMNAPLKRDHLLYDGKYRQIIASAFKLGMAPEEIFG